MTERIAADRGRGAGAIAAATTPTALEEVRIDTSAARPSCPNLLRDVAQLPPEERAATGKAANEARQALEAAIERKRAASSPPASSTQRLDRGPGRHHAPGDPLPALGRLHLITQTRREIEDVFIGLGFNVAEGPRSRPSTTTSTRSTSTSRTPRG